MARQDKRAGSPTVVLPRQAADKEAEAEPDTDVEVLLPEPAPSTVPRMMQDTALVDGNLVDTPPITRAGSLAERAPRAGSLAERAPRAGSLAERAPRAGSIAGIPSPPERMPVAAPETMPVPRGVPVPFTDLETLPVTDMPVTLDTPSGTVGKHGSESRASALSTPEGVLLAGEISRIRTFLLMLSGIATITALFVPFMGGHGTAKLSLTLGCIAGAIAAGVTSFGLQARRYTRSMLLIAQCIVALAMVPAYYYFGSNSAAVLLIPLTIVLFSMSQWGAYLWRALLVTCLSHLIIVLLTLSGIIEDRGLYVPREHSIANSLFSLAIIQGVFVAAYLLGRSIHDSSLRALAQHDLVVRDLARRDALLQEAMLEFDRARHAGTTGRYTDLVIGSFRLGALLGRGGMGEVYDAVHVTTGEPAAVKLLLPHALREPRIVERFLRELEIATTLRSAYIVRVLEIANPSVPIKYLAMERLRGQTLADMLRHQPVLPPVTVLRMLREVGAGVHAAHEAGIVHRDLKPGNLFLHQETEQRSLWKVLDFGVSKLAGYENTLTGSRIVGTPGYMAPEQASGQPVDHRADIFALGVITYRALTGMPAFPGSDIASILYAVIHTMPARPSMHRHVAKALDYVLAIALAKEPEQRFNDVLELVHAVDEALAGRIDRELHMRAKIVLEHHPWRWE